MRATNTSTKMKRRNYKYYLRKCHRYLGIFIGVQFVFWTAGGLYFSWINIDEIRGDHLRANRVHQIRLDRPLVPPHLPANQLIASGVAASIDKIRIVDVLGSPHYEMGFRSYDGKDELALADALTGELRQPVTEAEAVLIATEALREEHPVKSVAYIVKDNVGGHHEYREKPLPAWAVSFENTDGLTVYLSAQTGQIGAVRTDNWRIFDFLWMLHTMDFQERDNINNYILRAFSVLGIVTLLSGFLLFFASSKFWRKMFYNPI